MKCYIATYYQYDNYGTRLQNFALCRAIRKLGAEPVTLYIHSRKEAYRNIVKDVCSYIPSTTNRTNLWLNNRKKRQVFRNFYSKLCFEYMGYEELDNIDFSDGIAIAGSDQIWLPSHLAKNKRAASFFFLQFAPKEKRVAYAPSFGVEKIPDEMQEMYRKFLAEFAHLSIRESAGQNMIKNIINETVPVLPDPVFLLEKEEWREEFGNSVLKDRNEDYIVTYFLGKPGDLLQQKIKSYAEANHYKIVSIAGNYYRKEDVVPAPDEFVGILDGARAVFTDSFHASAFSIILGTPFCVFRRKDVEQFSRVETLLRTYGCLGGMADKDTFHERVLNISRDTEKIMKRERKKGLAYLCSIIKENEYDRR